MKKKIIQNKIVNKKDLEDISGVIIKAVDERFKKMDTRIDDKFLKMNLYMDERFKKMDAEMKKMSDNINKLVNSLDSFLKTKLGIEII